jgi:L-lactate dehydrogenase (cytochrome)
MLNNLRSVLRFRRRTGDRITRRLDRVVNVGDLRALARRRLPRGVFDYIDGGAEDEITLADNTDAFRRIRFVPDVLNDVGSVDTRTTIFGDEAAYPLVLAPTGFTRIADPAGELAVARAAGRAGLPYVLSTLATRSIEEVAAVATGPLWFQVYMWRDRDLVASLIERAAQASYRALVLTVDTAVFGRRERDVRRGFELPPSIGPGTIVDGMRHPGWTWQFLRSDPIRFANVTGREDVGDGADPVTLADYINAQFDPTLSWSDIEWLRDRWAGPIVLKGIQSAGDAVRAVDHGVEAIAVSNHGGRQLDGAIAPIDRIPAITDRIGDHAVVICDGGIRRGSDLVKVIAAGATAGMTGRPYLYGLGAAGERGVDHVLEHIREGVVRTMSLLGTPTLADVGPNLLDETDGWVTRRDSSNRSRV